jgi:hypothetical protein
MSKFVFNSICRNLPLRIVLIAPFVLQIVGTVGLIGYLSFKNGQKAINNLANQLMQEIGERLEENLDNYLISCPGDRLRYSIRLFNVCALVLL